MSIIGAPQSVGFATTAQADWYILLLPPPGKYSLHFPLLKALDTHRPFILSPHRRSLDFVKGQAGIPQVKKKKKSIHCLLTFSLKVIVA